MSFISETVNVVKKFVNTQSHIVVAMDTSGSTGSNDILRREIEFANKVTNIFKNNTCIAWNSEAFCVKNFENIRPDGGTAPASFVQLMKTCEVNADLLLLMTDGQITSIDQFRESLKQLQLNCPIIIVLTVPKIVAPQKTIEHCSDVNMSIVEACLTTSSNVAVLLQNDESDKVRFFQGTGYFAQFLDSIERAKPVNERFIAGMNLFEFEKVFPQQKKTGFSQDDDNNDNDEKEEEEEEEEELGSTFSSISSMVTSLFNMWVSNGKDTTTEKKVVQPDDDTKEEIEEEEEEKNKVSILFEELPSNVLQMSDGRYLLLDVLMEYIAKVDTMTAEEQQTLAFALTEAAKRTSLPKLDVEKMRIALRALKKTLSSAKSKSKTNGVKLQIYATQTQLLTTNESEQEQLRKQLKELRSDLAALLQEPDLYAVSTELFQAVESLALIIGQYAGNKAAFEYGSNRATAARTIEDAELQQIGKCVRGPCLVSLEEEDLCVYFQIPETVFARLEKENAKNSFERPVSNQKLTHEQKSAVALYFTRNQMIDNSALCGAAMMNCITAGTFGIQFAQSVDVIANPLTRVPIIGFVPLSLDMRTLIRFLSNVFCGGKEMPFILPAYVSMVAQHLAQNKWAQPQLREHAKFIVNKLFVRCPLLLEAQINSVVARGSSREEAKKSILDRTMTLADSISLKLQNPGVLRLLSFGQVQAMIDIAEQLLPERKIESGYARSVAQFCNTLRSVRENYIALAKGNRDAQEILLDCFRPEDGKLRNNLFGHMAWFFSLTHQRHGHKLRLMRFQKCIDYLVEDKEFGAYFLSSFIGKEYVGPTSFLVPKVEEPLQDSVHFDTKKSLAMYKYLLQPVETQTKTCCAYCEEEFDTRGEVARHAKDAMDTHFIEFSRILIHKPELFKGATDEKVEQKIMKYLQKRCGALNMAIYTQRTRHEIRAMIQARKEMK